MSLHPDPAALSEAKGKDRRAILEHVAACASCRSRLAQDEPESLFALLALTRVPEAALDAVSAEVAHRAGRDRTPIGENVRVAAWTRGAAAAAVLALAVLCGYEVLRPRPVAPAALSAAHPRADVDVATGRGVSQVIDLTVGETQIVMVYNGELKL